MTDTLGCNSDCGTLAPTEPTTPSPFIAPVFNTSADIEALIVLYQILDIMCVRRLNPTVSNLIVYQTVVQIINIKCKEYVEIKWNKNLETFMMTFETYINTMVENLLNCK
jgi:hypothetical protein